MFRLTAVIPGRVLLAIGESDVDFLRPAVVIGGFQGGNTFSPKSNMAARV